MIIRQVSDFLILQIAQGFNVPGAVLLQLRVQPEVRCPGLNHAFQLCSAVGCEVGIVAVQL